jgi:hypothetical protein
VGVFLDLSQDASRGGATAANPWRYRRKPHSLPTATAQTTTEALPVAQASDQLHLRLVPKAEKKRWNYTMLSREQCIAVLKAINRCPRPASTLRVWTACISAVDYDTGAIAASANELAEFAEVPASEARRSLAELARIGALLRLSRGRYAINPHVAWAGSEDRRETAAGSTRPVLQLVHDTER